MKINYAILFFLTCFNSCSVFAQQAIDQSMVENTKFIHTQIDSTRCELKQDSLYLSCSILNRTKTGANQAVMIKFILSEGNRSVSFSPFLFAGSQYYREAARTAYFMKKNLSPSIYPSQKKHKSGISYQASLPYETWMDHATLRIEEVLLDCCNEKNQGRKIIIEDLRLKPKKEGENHAKGATDSICVELVYAMNKYHIDQAFGNNKSELLKLDSITQSYLHGVLSIDSIAVWSFSSPDGLSESNTELAKKRMNYFQQFLNSSYSEFKDIPIRWIKQAQDWQGLDKLLEESELDHKEPIRAIVQSGESEERKKELLRNFDDGKTYEELLNHFYPKLRHSLLKIYVR